MQQQHFQKKGKHLASFCQTRSFFRTKLAFISFYSIHFSDLSNKICLILEYLQIISQLILFSPDLEGTMKTDNKLLFQIITYACKLLNPCHLLRYENSDSMTMIVLITMFTFSILKGLLFVYVSVVAHWNWKKIDFLLSVWRWVFKLQGHVLYYFLTSFWVQAIIESRTGSFDFEENLMMGVASWMICQEAIFSYFIETQMCYILPSQDFLSCKTYSLQILVLTQKVVVQICQLVFKDLLTAIWVSSVAILLCSLCRTHQFYSKLPLYRDEALKLQASLQSVVFSLEVSFLAHTIARSVDEEKADLNFLIVTWLILAGLCWKLFRRYLFERKMELLIPNETFAGGVPEFLIHKIGFYKQLKERAYLDIQGKEKKLMNLFEVVFDLQMDGRNEDQIFLSYLEKVSEKFPNHSFIELYKAYLENKGIASYSNILKTISNINQRKWSKTYLSSSILLYKIERAIRASYKRSSVNLNLEAYLSHYLKFTDLRECMLEEAELKIKICTIMLEENSNIGEITNIAQKIEKLRKAIDKRSKILLREIPDQYIAPVIICAQYQISLNYSLQKYEKYADRFHKHCVRLTKSFQKMTLDNENLYQSSNAFLLFSGEKANYGQILHCSQSIKVICGKENSSFIKSNISRLFPSRLAPYYEDQFRQIFTTKEDSILNKLVDVFIQTRSGNIIKAEIYTRIHPYVTSKLCLQVIIRAIPSAKDYLLISEDGKVEAASVQVSKMLNISSGSVDLKDLSEDLFNLLRKKEQIENQPEDLGKIHFTPFIKRGNHKNDSLLLSQPASSNYWYQCEIQTVLLGVKVISMSQSRGFSNKKPRKEQEKTVLRLQNVSFEESSHSEDIDCDEKMDNHLESGPLTTWANRETNLFTEGQQAAPTSPTSLLRTQAELPLLTLNDSPRPEQKYMQAQSSSREAIEENLEVSLRLKSISMTQRSREIQNFRSFHMAINTNSSPKTFMVLCFIFYCVIIGVCVGQALLMIVSDQTMGDLELKKDLLKYAEKRSFRANMISLNSVGGVLQTEGGLDEATMLQGIVRIIQNINFHRADLTRANDNILQALDQLDDKIQTSLRMKDVRMIGSDLDINDSTSMNFTSFQLVDTLGAGIIRLAKIADPSASQGLALFAFLVNNIVTDFLAKNEDIRNIFIESVKDQRQALENTINLCLILTPILLLGLATTIILIIWAQYRTERDYLLAFLNLSSDGVRRMQSRFRVFAKNLMNEGNFENFDYYSDYLYNLAGITQEEFQSYHQTRHSKENKYSQLQFKYYSYVGKVVLYVSSLVIIMLWDFLSAKHSAAAIYKQQEQLEFAQLISTRSTLFYNTYCVLFYANNTLPIQHTDAFEMLSDSSQEMTDIISQIPNKFKEQDGSYDPQLRKMIFDHADCDTFPEEDSTYCLNLESIGQRTNLISVAIQFQSFTQGKVEDYENVNKSSMAAILTAAYLNLQSYTAATITLAADAQLMAERIDNNLGRSISKFNTQRGLFLTLFIIALLIIGILIWFHILKKIKDIDNNFKKVLIIFPQNLILSSFLLKMFLKRTSNQVLTII